MKTLSTYRWKANVGAFLSGQAISLFGSALVQFAITWHITITTQSGVYAMLSIVCGFVPGIILSPFAGVWADRYNRKTLIVLADGGIALATLVLAILFLTGSQEIWLLLVVMAVRSLGSAVQQPSINAMLPSVVPTEHLTRVNGLYQSISSLITLASPFAGMGLYLNVPLAYIFFVDVITAVLAIGMLLAFFRLPAKQESAAPKAAAASGGGYFADVKAGLGYIKKHKYLRYFFIYMPIANFCCAPIAFLTQLQVTRNYQSEIYLMILEVVFSAGMLAGGLIISAWGGFKNRIITMGVAMIFMGLGIVGMGMPMPPWLYFTLMGVGGIVMPMMNTPAIVLLQEKVDPEYMGRVFSMMTMVGTSVMPLGMLLFGPLADVTRIEYLLIGTGAVMAATAFAMTRNRVLLEAGAPLPKKAEQAEETTAVPAQA